MGIAEQLRKSIQESGESTVEVAAACGLHRQILERFMSGERPNIRLDTINKLAAYFGLELTEKKPAKKSSRR